MLSSEVVNNFKTPINKQNIIPETSTTKNQNNFQIFCKDLSKINDLDECGWTPLYRSIISGDVSSTMYLLNNGADPNIKCTMGETPLYQAVEMEKIEHIKLLLKKGADPNITNDDNLSPLHIAVNKQNISIVKILLKYGANPNIKSKLYQQTPLHLAIKNNADPIFLLLLVQFNGSLLKEDKFNKKPVDYTNSKEMQSTIEKLKFGKEEKKIEKIKDVEKFETPAKKYELTPNNIYSNTIRSKSKGKELIITSNNAILKNPGNVKLTIIDGKNNIFSNDKNELSMNNTTNNNKPKEIVKKESLNLNEDVKSKQSENQIINEENQENKENIDINENNLNINEYNKSLDESIELEDINLNRKEIDYSLLRKKTGKFNDINQKTENNNTINDSILSNNSLRPKSIKLNINGLKPSDIDNNNNINNQKKSIRFSFSSNTFKNNKIKNTLSKSLEENKENININTNNQKTKNEEHKKTFKKQTNSNNKKKKRIIIKKFCNKEEMGNIKDKNINIDKNKCLYEKVIKKSITKIEIYDDIKETTNQTMTKDTNTNEEESKTKSSRKSLYNKPILNNKKINNLKKIFKNKDNHNSLLIKLNNSDISPNQNNLPKKKKIFLKKEKNKNLINKNLSYNKRIINKENINKENININTINSDNNKNRKTGSLSRGSMTTLTASGNEYLKNVNIKNGTNNCNEQNNLWKFRNDILYNEKSIYQSILSSNLNSERSNDYNSCNNKYPIYDWLKEIGLHCYYNLFKEKRIYTMEKVISNLKSGKYIITKNDIEKIGIIISGHIYRILTKLEIDSEKINTKISSYFINGKKRMSGRDINILNNSIYFCCGCCTSNERSIYNKIRKEFNLEKWLNKIKMIKYKENFIENGFDLFEYFILQMFSTVPIDDYILKEELGIENDKDRDIILLRLNKDVKYILLKTGNQFGNELIINENKLYELDSQQTSQQSEKNSECIII